ncbi:MAG TPA: rod shape-determining protein MreC [Candidatus Paceibacterota bacterium]|nr:rod shape-determining protein MreC [Candidatus Paceibacterota bacterium]
MKRIFVIMAFLLGVAILIATPFFINKPGRIVDTILQIFSFPSLMDEITKLRQENGDLKSQLFAARSQYELPSVDENRVFAKVFSLYPFNTKNRMYITAGSYQGIKIGDAVMFSKNVFVGQVTNAFYDKSEVITIFDSKFTLPVKIGSKFVDGLLEGGISPEIGLIDKNKQINPGDEIVATSKDLPFGLLVGSIKSIKEDSSGSFLKAQISLPYALSDISSVSVIKHASR